MEETQIETQNLSEQTQEPEVYENSADVYDEEPKVQDFQEGESLGQDPSADLILGKFKSVEDLSKAYQELERRQGLSSAELGALRRNVSELQAAKNLFDTFTNFKNGFVDYLDKYREKYNTPEYLQDPSFKELFCEAYKAVGDDLDMDKLVTLVEEYVSARIFAHDRKQSAKNETENALESMTYDKNPKTEFIPPKKRFDEMTPKEVDELLERLI